MLSCCSASLSYCSSVSQHGHSQCSPSCLCDNAALLLGLPHSVASDSKVLDLGSVFRLLKICLGLSHDQPLSRHSGKAHAVCCNSDIESSLQFNVACVTTMLFYFGLQGSNAFLIHAISGTTNCIAAATAPCTVSPLVSSVLSLQPTGHRPICTVTYKPVPLFTSTISCLLQVSLSPCKLHCLRFAQLQI